MFITGRKRDKKVGKEGGLEDASDHGGALQWHTLMFLGLSQFSRPAGRREESTGQNAHVSLSY